MLKDGANVKHLLLIQGVRRQHNFPRLGKWRSLTSLPFELQLPPNPRLPKEVDFIPSNIHKSLFTAFSIDIIISFLVELWKKRKKTDRGRKRESFKVFAIHQKKNLKTPLNSNIHEKKMNDRNRHSNVFPHYSFSWPGPNQNMWATWAAVYFNAPLLWKDTFDIYLEKRLWITWLGASKR